MTQTIFSASLIAATLPARLPELTPAAQTDMEMLQVLTKGALAEMRTLLLELRPEHLEEVPLEILLTQLAQAFSGRTGVPATVNANCDARLCAAVCGQNCLLPGSAGGAQQRSQARQGQLCYDSLFDARSSAGCARGSCTGRVRSAWL